MFLLSASQEARSDGSILPLYLFDILSPSFTNLRPSLIGVPYVAVVFKSRLRISRTSVKQMCQGCVGHLTGHLLVTHLECFDHFLSCVAQCKDRYSEWDELELMADKTCTWAYCTAGVLAQLAFTLFQTTLCMLHSLKVFTQRNMV